jgi:hypothetical protein
MDKTRSTRSYPAPDEGARDRATEHPTPLHEGSTRRTTSTYDKPAKDKSSGMRTGVIAAIVVAAAVVVALIVL